MLDMGLPRIWSIWDILCANAIDAQTALFFG